MFRILFFLALGLIGMGILGCSTENPICTDNFCATGEVFEREELGDTSFAELPANINEQEVLEVLGLAEETAGTADQTWEHLITLERHPLAWDRFSVPTEADNDLITDVFARGYDMLFVIRRERFIYHEQFFLHQPVAPGTPALAAENNPQENLLFHKRHFPSISSHWFQEVPSDFEDTAGLTMIFDLTLSPDEDALYASTAAFRTSFNGDLVEWLQMPFIRDDVELEIYFRTGTNDR